MPYVGGSNGNDILIGTAFADRIVPLLGFDGVDGGDGQDTLVVDYSAVPAAGITTYFEVYTSYDSFGGYLQSGDGLNSVGFNNIERLELKLDNGNTYVWFEGWPLGQGASADIDAGEGYDHLSLNLDAIDGVTFKVGPNGKVNLNGSTFSNFEGYFLWLGTGNDTVQLGDYDDSALGNAGDDIIDGGGGNDVLFGGFDTNTVSGGTGDDRIYSEGVDSVDGGTGFDTWIAGYDWSAENMSFVYDGSSGSLSNGTTLTGIEKVEYFGGSGDDDVAISGALTGADGTPSVSLAAGDGYDTLAADLSDGVQSNDVISLGLDNGVISGTAPGISLSGFEEVTFTGDVHDTASLSLLPLDGGVEVSVQPDGTLMTNVGVTLLNYDSFVIQTGEGDDTIVAGANNDTIIGGGGGDATWGGTGADTFAFLAAEDFGSGPLDWIRDFSSTEGDKIDLQGVAAGEFAFIGGAGFSGGGVAELRYEDIGGGPNSVQGDLDGDGVADFSFLVSSSVPLSETDFFL